MSHFPVLLKVYKWHDCMKLLISGVLIKPIMVRSSMVPLFKELFTCTSNRLKSLITILVMYYGTMIRIPGQRPL